MSVRVWWSGVALASIVAAGLVPLSPAVARDSLPWADANPLEPLHPSAGSAKPTRKAVSPKPVVKTTESAAASAPASVPVPEARPETAAPDKPGGSAEGADSAKPPVDDHSPQVQSPPPAKADAAKDLPTTQIPVPETRPAETPAQAPAAAVVSPPPADAPPSPLPVETPKPETRPGTAVPDDAPNATEKLKAREIDITPAASVAAAAAVEDAENCEAELKRRGVEFTIGESISEGDCGVLRPISVTRLSSGVAVSPKTQMLCRAALALDDWMTGSVVPAAKTSFPGEKVKEFQHASTYVCRPRASESGISEHARGSAIDIAAFVFDKGRTIGVEAQPPGTPEEAFQAAVRAGACGPFRTVLGPGTDADHATHFHLDIAARHNGATYCK